MVVAAASPLTVIGGGAPIGIGLGNGAGFPALFPVVTAILVIFAVGLTAMARVVAKPGAFYTYIGSGLGRHAGAAAAWLAILCYTVTQVSVHAYLGYLISRTVQSLIGVSVPWWLCSLAVVALTGVLGYRHIDLSSKVLGVLLIGEILVVALITVAVLVTGGGEGLSGTSFTPEAVTSGAPGVGLLFAIAAYIGFEATAVYRDEARTPERTIPRATYGALIGIGIFYTIGSWAIVTAWGPSAVQGVAAADPGNLLQSTSALYAGAVGPVIVNVLIMTSMFACVLSFHNVLARYMLSMSVSGLLPRSLAVVHGSHGSPHRGSLVQTTTAAGLIVLFALLGLDPLVQVFGWFAGVATLGALLLMFITSIAAIVFFRRGGSRGLGRWRTLIAPAIGGLGLAALTAVLVANFPVLVGDMDERGQPQFGVVSTLLITLCFVPLLAGLVQAAVIRRRSPATFATLLTSIGETHD